MLLYSVPNTLQTWSYCHHLINEADSSSGYQHLNVSQAKNASVAEAVYPGAPFVLEG